MIPHERSLVQKHEGKPFALIGVNTDGNLEEVKRKSAEHKVTWRSFYDGPNGPICQQWKVRAFPTIYVIDHQGMIRYENVRGAALDEAVDALLRELPPQQ
jgi:hypothetical protein